VLSQPGARTVIQADGVNDLMWGGATADQLIAGMREVADRARARGLRVVGATVVPYQGYGDSWSEEKEAVRQQLNMFVRNSGEVFDAVADFDRAVRDQRPRPERDDERDRAFRERRPGRRCGGERGEPSPPARRCCCPAPAPGCPSSAPAPGHRQGRRQGRLRRRHRAVVLLAVPDRYGANPSAAVVVPYRHIISGRDDTPVSLFTFGVDLAAGKELRSLVLPMVSDGLQSGVPALHVFAMTIN
jgi:hypothetical protein